MMKCMIEGERRSGTLGSVKLKTSMVKKNKEKCECNGFDKMEALFMILTFIFLFLVLYLDL